MDEIRVENSAPESAPMPKKKSKKWFWVVLLVIVVAGILYWQFGTTPSDPQEAAAQEVAAVVKEVSKVMVLPEGEDPAVGTIVDLEVIKDQPFFAKAELGDKVLIYPAAGKVILYSVSLGRILEVAPLNVTPPQVAPEPVFEAEEEE